MSVVSELITALCQLWKPPPNLRISEWAETHRFLTSESSAETGKWVSKPYQREPMDSISDPRVHTVVMMSSTQMLKTECGILNPIGYFIDQDPGPILIVMPTASDGAAFSKDRLAPMIAASPALREKVWDPRGRRSDNTITHKRFNGGHVTVTAPTPSGLASRPIRYLLCDEIDKYPASAGSEGDPISLARKRTVTYRNRRKTVLTCSPTVAGRSRIAKAYEDSDQRKFWVPCPECGQFQVLKWAQVKSDTSLPHKVRPKTAYYECEHCTAQWFDGARWAAVEKGEWRATVPFNGTAGFWISELYSPWKNLGDILADFLAAGSDRELLKAFVNTSLAELWQEAGETPDEELLYARREPYPFGEEAVVPKRGLFLTASVDVQDEPPRLEVEVIAWGRDRENWSIDYQVLQAHLDPEKKHLLPVTAPQLWDLLDKSLNKKYRHENGGLMEIMVMTIDTGKRAKPVYTFASKHARPAYGPAGIRIVAPRTVVPVKGTPDGLRIISSVSKEDAARKRQNIRIVGIGTHAAKQEIFDSLRHCKPNAKEAVAGCYHHPMYEKSYFEGLCSERRVVRDNGEIIWEKTTSRNEPLDLKVYNRGAASIFGIDRFNEKHWSALARHTAADTGADVDEEGDPQPPPPPPKRKEKKKPWLERRQGWLR